MAGRFVEAREHILAINPLLDQAVQTDFSLQSRSTIAEAMEWPTTWPAPSGNCGWVSQMRDARGAGPGGASASSSR